MADKPPEHMDAMPAITMARRVQDYRCPGCGASWGLSVDKLHAIGWPRGKHASLDMTDGWFMCPTCGSETRFRWAAQDARPEKTI